MSDTITSLPLASTIDPAQDWIAIDTTSLTSTQRINRNTYLNLGSAPAGLTDSQTLTNKTLTSPTISGPTLSGTITGTYTIGGTPTFPSSVMTLTGTQTAINKTLTSPTINSPTITNATLSADTITGFTTSNSGTIYGMSVTGGLLASAAIAGQVVTASLATGIQTVQVSKNPYKFSVYRNAAYTTSGGWPGTTVLVFDTKLYDTGNNFSTSTGLFTAPIAGFYQFNVYASANLSSGVGHGINLVKNGAALGFGTGGATGSTTFNYSDATAEILQLSANDTIGVNFYASANGGAVGINLNRFSGFLVSAT